MHGDSSIIMSYIVYSRSPLFIHDQHPLPTRHVHDKRIVLQLAHTKYPCSTMQMLALISGFVFQLVVLGIVCWNVAPGFALGCHVCSSHTTIDQEIRACSVA